MRQTGAVLMGHSSIALINTCSPYSNLSGQESLDLAMVGGSFGQDVALFFIDDGVYQLLNGQSPESIDKKNYSKSFAALEFYDVEDVFVCQRSMMSRGLETQNLLIDVQLLNKDQWHKKIGQYKHVIRF